MDTIYNYIKGKVRLEGESFEEYKKRRKEEDKLFKFYKRYGGIPVRMKK